jgi:hypothetical protein
VNIFYEVFLIQSDMTSHCCGSQTGPRNSAPNLREPAAPREPLLPPPPRFRDVLEEVPETPYSGLFVHFTHPAIRSSTKRSVPKIGDVQRILSGIGSRSTDTMLAMESCTRTTGTSN